MREAISRILLVVITVILLTVTAIGVAAQAEDPTARPPIPSAGCGTSEVEVGQHRDLSTVVGRDERTWAMYVPEAHNGEDPLPLWVQLHPRGGRGSSEILNNKWAADELGFVLAAPDASSGNDWMWRLDVEIDASLSNPDIAFVDALLDQLGEELCVDLARVYAAGFSAGGTGTSILRCAIEDRLAAVATVSGVIDLGDACELDRPVPLMHVHGKADSLALFDGGMGGFVAFLNDTAPIGEFLQRPVPEHLAGIAAHNGCGPEAVVEPLDDDVERWAWACPVGADVELVAHAGGHVWERDFVTMIWEFFEQHPMPE